MGGKVRIVWLPVGVEGVTGRWRGLRGVLAWVTEKCQADRVGKMTVDREGRYWLKVVSPGAEDQDSLGQDS